MARIDGALRESMRLWSFVSRGVLKLIVAPRRVRLRLESIYRMTPRSRHGLCCSPWWICLSTPSASHEQRSDLPYSKRPLVVNPLESFLAGSQSWDLHGFQARAPFLVCYLISQLTVKLTERSSLGLFFTVNQLKNLLALITLHYEIEAIKDRYLKSWLNNSIGPPIWSKIRVRRRPTPTGGPSYLAMHWMILFLEAISLRSTKLFEIRVLVKPLNETQISRSWVCSQN